MIQRAKVCITPPLLATMLTKRYVWARCGWVGDFVSRSYGINHGFILLVGWFIILAEKRVFGVVLETENG